MKLESLDELDEYQNFFCRSCGKQLHSVDEIAQRICHACKQSSKETTEVETFFCWACGKQLAQMSEVAQGLCHSCKASIIRKIRSPVKKSNPSSEQK